MLRKKIKKIIISLLLLVLVFTSGMLVHKFTNKPMNTTKVEHRIDMTQFKIKQILETNKLETLQINFTATLNDSSYNQSKYQLLDSMSKFFTSKQLTIEGDYKAIFSYDLSKAQFIDNKDNTYTIVLNTNDIEINLVEINSPTVKENISKLGYYYDSKIVAQLTYKLKEMATQKINTYDNKGIALQNTKDDLFMLFKNVGIDVSKINIILN